MEAQRLRCYWIGENELLRLLNWANGVPETIAVPEFATQIPEGAAVVSIQHDWSRRGFAVILLHPSFEEIVDGYEIPRASGGLIEGYRVVRIEGVDRKQPAG